jgi:hypothetical protein
VTLRLQTLLRALELTFELLHPGTRAKSPPVQAGPQQRDPVAEVSDLRLQRLLSERLVARALIVGTGWGDHGRLTARGRGRRG